MGKCRYVAIDSPDSGGMYCLGVFDDYRMAVGEVMKSVWEIEDGYQDKEDYFSYTRFEMMEGEGGEVMEVRFKSRHREKAAKSYYYILYLEEG